VFSRRLRDVKKCANQKRRNQGIEKTLIGRKKKRRNDSPRRENRNVTDHGRTNRVNC